MNFQWLVLTILKLSITLKTTYVVYNADKNLKCTS